MPNGPVIMKEHSNATLANRPPVGNIYHVAGGASGASGSEANPHKLALPYRNDARRKARFVLLRFDVVGQAKLDPQQTVRIPLGNGQEDTFTAADGQQFWTRPILPSSDGEIEIIMPQTTGADIQITAYGHGTLDVFKVDGDPSDDIAHTPNAGAPESQPRWEAISDLDPQVKAEADLIEQAAAVGMLLYARKCSQHDEAELETYHQLFPDFYENQPTCNSGQYHLIGQCSGAKYSDNQVLSAAHAFKGSIENAADMAAIEALVVLEAQSGSITFDYDQRTEKPTFHKLLEVDAQGTAYKAQNVTGIDYVMLQFVPDWVPATPPTSVRLFNQEFPVGGEVYIIHHPRGRTKRISRPKANPNHPCIYEKLAVTAGEILNKYPNYSNAQVQELLARAEKLADAHIFCDCDVDSGSSGSPIFARVMTEGTSSTLKVIGIMKSTRIPLISIGNWGPEVTSIFKHLNEEAFGQAANLVLAVDTSGSMRQMSLSGQTKMQATIEALTLFLAQLRVTPLDGKHHAVSIVDFDTTARLEKPFTRLNSETARQELIQALASLQAVGKTTIGGALQLAGSELENFQQSAGKLNRILLMTDGLHNHGPSISVGEQTLTAPDLQLHTLGFGQVTALNINELFRLAETHGGDFLHAEKDLDLLKYYAIEYGYLLGDGVLVDPDALLAADEDAKAHLPFTIGLEQALTVTLGWERPDAGLQLTLEAPNGERYVVGGQEPAGVTSREGKTWAFLRIEGAALQAGTWQAVVERETRELRWHGHQNLLTAVSFSPAGVYALSADVAEDVRLWRVNQGRCVRQFIMPQPFYEQEDPVVAALFAPDGQTVLLAKANGYGTYLASIATGDPLLYLLPPEEIEQFGVLRVLLPDDSPFAFAALRRIGLVVWPVQDLGERLQQRKPIRALELEGILDIAVYGNRLAVLSRLGDEPRLQVALYDLNRDNMQNLESALMTDPFFVELGGTGASYAEQQSGRWQIDFVQGGQAVVILPTLDLHTEDETEGFVYYVHLAERQVILLEEIGALSVRDYAVFDRNDTRLLITDGAGVLRRLNVRPDQQENIEIYTQGVDLINALAIAPGGTLQVLGDEAGILHPVRQQNDEAESYYNNNQYPERYILNAAIESPLVIAYLPENRPIVVGSVLRPRVLLRYKNGATLPEAQIVVTMTRPDSDPDALREQYEASRSDDPDEDAIWSFGDDPDAWQNYLAEEVRRRAYPWLSQDEKQIVAELAEDRREDYEDREREDEREDGNIVLDYRADPVTLTPEVQLVPIITRTITLSDAGDQSVFIEPNNGIYSALIENETPYPGTYRFHAVATFGPQNQFRRELFWSVTVQEPDRRTTAEFTGA